MNRFPSLFISGLLLASCSSKPTNDLYVLRPDAPLAGTRCESLVIARPSARAEYDTKRIAILLAPNQVTYYTGAAWVSPFPDQLRAFLSEAYTQAGRSTTNQHVAITIQQAAVEELDAPIVHLRLAATFTAQGARQGMRILIDEKVPARENKMEAIIEAYTVAATRAAEQIAGKCLAR